jgi:uncharacterized protein (TIGR00725 family)
MKSHARPVLAVLGPAKASELEMDVAERVGAAAAEAGWVVLTGGGPGVMLAASRGAVQAGGTSLGILPVGGPTESYPNPWVQIAVYTETGNARNAFNVLSADLCVAIGGGPGTLSEIALSLKRGKDVWCWRSWAIKPPPGTAPPEPRVFASSEELLAELILALGELDESAT